MPITVELHVQRPLIGGHLHLLVHALGLGDQGMFVSLVDLPELLLAIATRFDGDGRGLRSVDAWRAPSPPMDDTVLRLVIELTSDDAGSTNVTLRRMDRSVDYGPLSVHDLPHVIAALVTDHSVESGLDPE